MKRNTNLSKEKYKINKEPKNNKKKEANKYNGNIELKNENEIKMNVNIKIKENKINNNNINNNNEIIKPDESNDSNLNNLNQISDDNYEIERSKLLDYIHANQTKLINVASSLPKKDTLTLDEFALYMKEKTQNLKEIEKVYILFYWIYLDDKKYLDDGNKIENSVHDFESALKIGRGYNQYVYQYIGEKIGLQVGLITGYVNKKNISKDSDYTWNYIIINGLYFLLNINFAIGYYKDGKYINKIDEFFFLSSPRRFLFRHFPLK